MIIVMDCYTQVVLRLNILSIAYSISTDKAKKERFGSKESKRSSGRKTDISIRNLQYYIYMQKEL